MASSDLCDQDLTLKHGWRTGAIIPELRSELKIMNTEQYIQTMTWLQTLTGLLEQMQVGVLLLLLLFLSLLFLVSFRTVSDQSMSCIFCVI